MNLSKFFKVILVIYYYSFFIYIIIINVFEEGESSWFVKNNWFLVELRWNVW